MRLELKKTLEQKWQTLRWVTDHLDNNELRAMLTDLREVENDELRKWNKMKRFYKIEQFWWRLDNKWCSHTGLSRQNIRDVRSDEHVTLCWILSNSPSSLWLPDSE